MAHPSRIAVVDFGSNSLKLSLFRIAGKNRLRLEWETREFTAVGDDVFSTGSISLAKAQEVEQAIGRLRERLSPDDTMVAAATSAFRDAVNGPQMLERFGAQLGTEIQILDGLEEATLIAEGVLHELGDSAERAAVLDIGGGSVEIIRVDSARETEVISLDLGAIRLRERFGAPPDHQAPAPEVIREMDAYARLMLETLEPLPANTPLYGSGGGFTTLGDVLFGAENRSGVVVEREALREAAGRLQMLPASETMQRFGLPLRRARIMPAGSIVALRAIERLGAGQLVISWAGLREGLALRAAKGQA